MHILIVGAGLGGLTLAQALRKRGISFEIFERDVDETARFQGWAIAIHTKWLLTNIPVQWGKHVVRVKHRETGVSVTFKDGSTARGDMVVGADGVHSPVREHILQRPSSDLLRVVPLTAIVGEVSLSGEAFRRQLELGHSAYNLINPELGFIGFVGLHHAFPDGNSGRFYWMFMQPRSDDDDDDDVSGALHWAHTSTQQEKRDHVLKATEGLAPRLREIFELTPVEGIKDEPHVWRDMELDHLPAGRVVLLGDAAHAMTPSRGEGAFHAFLDAIKLSAIVTRLRDESEAGDDDAVEAAVAAYNAEIPCRGSRRSRFEGAELEVKIL
ncbi:Salicylate hydroxylase [Escovopsis weberi]|uniref:Salicylate hydroxylase n=1 Tax=Escovopsis weberi TaxID=150374 RepID=A0A0M9VSX3_ESCWE|nr:Salicylate hydroxylase [Escovopsis weberi]